MTDKQLPANYRVSIKALITDSDGHLLMVKEQAFHWDLPGGGLDHGESIEQALRRELHEELDVELRAFSPKPIFAWVFDCDIPESRRRLWLVYEVSINGKPSITEEITAFEYRDLDALKPSDVAKYIQPAYTELISYKPTDNSPIV